MFLKYFYARKLYQLKINIEKCISDLLRLVFMISKTYCVNTTYGPTRKSCPVYTTGRTGHWVSIY